MKKIEKQTRILREYTCTLTFVCKNCKYICFMFEYFRKCHGFCPFEAPPAVPVDLALLPRWLARLHMDFHFRNIQSNGFDRRPRRKCFIRNRCTQKTDTKSTKWCTHANTWVHILTNVKNRNVGQKLKLLSTILTSLKTKCPYRRNFILWRRNCWQQFWFLTNISIFWQIYLNWTCWSESEFICQKSKTFKGLKTK